MPPPTPRTTSAAIVGGAYGLVGRLGGEQAGVDLAQRDRERLLLRGGLHQRADVLEQALAELAVVGVDLAGARLAAKITSAYFDEVFSSSSSIGGLVMPSGLATVPDTGRRPQERRVWERRAGVVSAGH